MDNVDGREFDVDGGSSEVSIHRNGDGERMRRMEIVMVDNEG